MQPSRHLAQFSIWTVGLGILDAETQLKSLKMQKDSKVIKYHQCSLEKSYAVSNEPNSEL